MQKLWRGSTGLASSIPIQLRMQPAFQLRTSPASPTPTDFHHRSGLAHWPSNTCCCGINTGGTRSLSRAWSPLLLQARESCRMWVFSGSGARGLTVSQGLNGREKRASMEGAEKGEKMVENSGGDEKVVAGGGESRSRVAQPQRQRGGNSTGAAVASADLLTIPGVGPRNLRKLVDKGFSGVSQLKQLYRDKFFYGDSSEKMVQFLQSSVGIIHKSHAESITTFIKDSVDEELKQLDSNSDVKHRPKKRLTFCVEGNISVGKTTFLQRIANETLELRDLVEVVPEPISKWQDIGPDHFNILDAFYAEPKRYAYTFQNYVFVTRFVQERDSAAGIKPLRLMERSVFSDRMVFVRAVHEANWMNEMEISIYDSWFDPVVSCLPGLVPDGFIYLRASPDTCHKRMMLRKREEEGGVSLDYLRELHKKHESWLLPIESGNHGMLSVSQLPLHVDNSLHPEIKDRVFYLEGSHMHPSIHKVPALILDCEPNIDFNKDIEAKRQYARQVAEFFTFVQKKRDETPDKIQDVKPANQQIILSPEGGLWIPQGCPLPDSALKSLDFRRAMPPFMPAG